MEYIYSCAIPTIKMSVILFYHRIFSVARFNYVLYFCSFLVIGWFIGVIVVNLVQCNPTPYFWKQYADPNAKGKCLDVEGYFMGNGIGEAITDFLILCAPFREVYKLQMRTAQKLALAGIFGLGALYVPIKSFLCKNDSTNMNQQYLRCRCTSLLCGSTDDREQGYHLEFWPWIYLEFYWAFFGYCMCMPADTPTPCAIFIPQLRYEPGRSV